jgi:hypothetical protein
MSFDRDAFTRDAFKAAQQPHSWLSSAEKLAAAAELIMSDQVCLEVAYFRAYENAQREALSLACASADEAGSADIECEAPNYLPAQLLFAFAIENVLKGLIIAKNPSLTGEREISSEIKSHDLVKLAGRASVEVYPQETSVLDALSEIAWWAGRYPVATGLGKYRGINPLGDPHALLDYGAHHPTVRRFFTRVVAELEGKVRQPRVCYGSVVVFALKTA